MKKIYFKVLLCVLGLTMLAFSFYPTFSKGKVTDHHYEDNSVSVTTEKGYRIRVYHLGNYELDEVKGNVELLFINRTYFITNVIKE